MVDRIVGRQIGVAVEAARTERLLEGTTYRGQCGAVPAEQMPGDIRHLGGEELVHPAYVIDPHDFQRGLE